jgi:hypothetical protein
MSARTDPGASAALAAGRVAPARAARTILLGGLAVGVLDGLAAVGVTLIRGSTPDRMFQYIASGLMGRAAYTGGWRTAALGVLLHLLIAFTLAAVYYAASQRFRLLLRHTLTAGTAYGLIAFLTMHELVIPLSAVMRPAFSGSALLTGMIIHILFVGMPIALVTRWSAGVSPP